MSSYADFKDENNLPVKIFCGECVPKPKGFLSWIKPQNGYFTCKIYSQDKIFEGKSNKISWAIFYAFSRLCKAWFPENKLRSISVEEETMTLSEVSKEHDVFTVRARFQNQIAPRKDSIEAVGGSVEWACSVLLKSLEHSARNFGV